MIPSGLRKYPGLFGQWFRDSDGPGPGLHLFLGRSREDADPGRARAEEIRDTLFPPVEGLRSRSVCPPSIPDPPKVLCVSELRSLIALDMCSVWGWQSPNQFLTRTPRSACFNLIDSRRSSPVQPAIEPGIQGRSPHADERDHTYCSFRIHFSPVYTSSG